MESDESHIRTGEAVRATLKAAKVDESQIKNPVQVLYYEEDVDSDIRLLELDKDMLVTLEKGQCLFFKGEKDDRLLCTTGNRTYVLEEAETSNTLLLCPNMKFGNEIPRVISESENGEIMVEPVIAKGIFHTYLESIPCKPQLGKLITLLEPTSFKGLEYEKQIDENDLYTWDRLNSTIQASEKELKDAMTEYMIVKIDGYYRLISFEFESKALTMMLDYLEENSWSVNQARKDETYEALKDLIPKSIFNVIFHKYTSKNDDNALYTYNEQKVCQFLAQVLLAGSPVNDYKLFMEAWKMGVPEGINPKLEYLHGIAVVVWNNEKMRKEVVSFPESKLSNRIPERFKDLFRVKDKWTAEEISPYIKNLSTPSLSVDFLLTKHARSLMINGVKYYTSKYK